MRDNLDRQEREHGDEGGIHARDSDNDQGQFQSIRQHGGRRKRLLRIHSETKVQKSERRHGRKEIPAAYQGRWLCDCQQLRREHIPSDHPVRTYRVRRGRRNQHENQHHQADRDTRPVFNRQRKRQVPGIPLHSRSNEQKRIGQSDSVLVCKPKSWRNCGLHRRR